MWSVAEADAIVICSCMPYIQEKLQALLGSTSEDVDEGKPMPSASSAAGSSANPPRGHKFRRSHDSTGAQEESLHFHEGELVMVPATLSPTPVERVEWSARTPDFQHPTMQRAKVSNWISTGSSKFRRFPPRVDPKAGWQIAIWERRAGQKLGAYRGGGCTNIPKGSW